MFDSGIRSHHGEPESELGSCTAYRSLIRNLSLGEERLRRGYVGVDLMPGLRLPSSEPSAANQPAVREVSRLSSQLSVALDSCHLSTTPPPLSTSLLPLFALNTDSVLREIRLAVSTRHGPDMTIHDLPIDVVILVFSLLHGQDIARCMMVSILTLS